MDVRENNSALNLAEYRNHAIKLQSRPQYVLVELTQGCNLACPMCRETRLSLKGRSMSLALFDRIAEQLFPTARMVDLRGWGESLVVPHLKHCVEVARDYGPEVRFVTNLAMRNPPVDLLAESRAHVAVSIDSANAQIYQQLRRGADFKRFRANLAALVAAYARHNSSRELLTINATVSNPSLAGLPDLVDFAHDMGIVEICLFEVFAARAPDLSLAGQEQRVDDALDRVRKRISSKNVRVRLGTRLGTMPEKAAGGPECLHPWSYALCAYDGGVGFCDHLNGPDGEDYILGSLNERSFEDIWNGPAWVELRREHVGARRGKAANFSECAWCYQHRNVDFEDWFADELQPTIL